VAKGSPSLHFATMVLELGEPTWRRSQCIMHILSTGAGGCLDAGDRSPKRAFSPFLWFKGRWQQGRKGSWQQGRKGHWKHSATDPPFRSRSWRWCGQSGGSQAGENQSFSPSPKLWQLQPPRGMPWPRPAPHPP
jgi:hypothetical protein